MKKKQRKHFLQRVRELTLAGFKQTHICRMLNISYPTVKKYQRLQNLSPRKKDTGEGLHCALGIVDRVFGNRPLPFEPQRDSGIAAAMVEVLAKCDPLTYRYATEQNLVQLQNLVVQALSIKRRCGADNFVH
jgi:hypothetical protein